MKRAILSLTFVFAITSLSAQTKKKPEPKVPPAPVQPVVSPVQQPQFFTFKLDFQTLNTIIQIIQTSPEIDARTSSQLVKYLVGQANDTTLNKPVPKPKDN